MDMSGSIPEEGPTTPTGQRRMMETWIVLELCNRGSLQVPLSLFARCRCLRSSHSFKSRTHKPKATAYNCHLSQCWLHSIQAMLGAMRRSLAGDLQ